MPHASPTKSLSSPADPRHDRMDWTTTFVVTGDGRPEEEFDDLTSAIVRANARYEAVVVRLERGDAFETRQQVWPTLGHAETRRK